MRSQLIYVLPFKVVTVTYLLLTAKRQLGEQRMCPGFSLDGVIPERVSSASVLCSEDVSSTTAGCASVQD